MYTQKNDIIDGANDVQSNVNRWNVGGVPQFLGKPTMVGLYCCF